MTRIFAIAVSFCAMMLFVAGCSPITEAPTTSMPDGPAAEWAGIYEGRCLLTCSDLGAFEREMATTLRLYQAGEELNIQLFLVPDLAYSPKFRRTAPVYHDNIISFHIEHEAFIYHAELHRNDDHVVGFLWATDLNDFLYWEATCIEVDRD